MYFSDEIILITTDDSGTDEIGRQTETEMGRVTVYGDIKSVSREESFTAGSHGYSNVQKFVLHPWDYSGEKYAMVDGKRKLIYRTYQADWCCTIKVDIENSKGQYIEKDKQEATKDGSESTKIQHGI